LLRLWLAGSRYLFLRNKSKTNCPVPVGSVDYEEALEGKSNSGGKDLFLFLFIQKQLPPLCARSHRGAYYPDVFRDIIPARGYHPGVFLGHRPRMSIPVGCAFNENHIRLGLVLRNEYPAWYFYREISGVIRSILVPQERLAEGATSPRRQYRRHEPPMLAEVAFAISSRCFSGTSYP